MDIEEIKNKEVWENFLAQCQEKTFLQSWNWGDFQKAMGNKIWRLGLYSNQELLSTVLILKIKAKRGKFLLIQHGPNIKTRIKKQKEQILKALLEEIKKISKQENCSFVRISPLWERNEENEIIFKNFDFKESPMHANAYEATWKLDIRLSEEELMKNMRKTTRYLIRQADKNSNIEIIKSNKKEDVKLFAGLSQKVAGSQRFVPFSFEFSKNEFETFAKNDQALLFLGKYRGRAIASALVVFWQNIGFYHQAALDPRYHKLPIAYLLQWEAIKEAKLRKCSFYDFWGYVDPRKYSRHPWAGPTFFKMGFGGKACEYVKTQDFPLSWKYWLVYAFEKIRRIKRGL